MTKDKFLLVSLEEDKAKKLAQIISSETARKILNLLSEKDYSETEISKKLNQPLNTIHYNIKQLEKAGLIESKEYKWSEKGKKIKYYKPVNKYIVIAPKEKDLSLILKNIIPATTIGMVISGIVYYIQNLSAGVMETSKGVMLAEAPRAGEVLEDTAQEIIISQPNYALYFLIGVLITSLLYLIVNYWRNKK